MDKLNEIKERWQQGVDHHFLDGATFLQVEDIDWLIQTIEEQSSQLVRTRVAISEMERMKDSLDKALKCAKSTEFLPISWEDQLIIENAIYHKYLYILRDGNVQNSEAGK